MEKLEFITNIEISADSKKVWDIFADFCKYPEWNPFIKTGIGKLELNESILFVDYVANHIYLPFLMKIIKFDLGKLIVWEAKMPGFYDYHEYKFEKIENGKTLFSHKAHFSGILAQSFKNHLEGDIRKVHEEMNLALKKRSENF